jgi:hypothetical protein
MGEFFDVRRNGPTERIAIQTPSQSRVKREKTDILFSSLSLSLALQFLSFFISLSLTQHTVSRAPRGQRVTVAMCLSTHCHKENWERESARETL